MSDRNTVNMHNPLYKKMPPIGKTIVLTDGRSGYVAGSSNISGKFSFIENESRKIYNMWPAEFCGFVVIGENK